jgi:uncharacterized protein
VAGADALKQEYSYEMMGQRPLPDPDPVSEQFWQGAREHRLLVQTCERCDLRRFPPRVMCPRCQSLRSRWDEVSGQGHIWSFIVCHPPLLPYFAARSPWLVALIELEESDDLRMVGQVILPGAEHLTLAEPERVKIGDPVRVVFEDCGEFTLPQWQLVG